ncbi:hypothetical protein FSP39_012291 [Pinctada imbricata]|uniref:Uncharacterized protein n=1 Tax=Pinctada imbricata TaxID=66713 RepID=A0AA88XM56_PINIB|nr:hypothetical protein FSP39_012291 [Pinctada imbricata]
MERSTSSNVDNSSECLNPNVTRQCQSYFSTQLRQADMVNFTLYFESNCPDCKNFFRSQLSPNYEKLSGIMNLTLVPYGNAREQKSGSGKWKFTCQHGKEECIGNLIETCAIHLMKNISSYFPFISCIENDQFAEPQDSAEKCAKKLGVDFKSIKECANSDLGNKLEHEMAVRTDALSPPHKYVPWVTLNGVHTEDIEQQAEKDLVKLICGAYKGSDKPAICGEFKSTRRCYRY